MSIQLSIEWRCLFTNHKKHTTCTRVYSTQSILVCFVCPNEIQIYIYIHSFIHCRFTMDINFHMHINSLGLRYRSPSITNTIQIVYLFDFWTNRINTENHKTILYFVNTSSCRISENIFTRYNLLWTLFALTFSWLHFLTDKLNHEALTKKKKNGR